MYVLSIDDNGQERNFLATSLEFRDSIVVAVIRGDTLEFKMTSLLDVLPLHESAADLTLAQSSSH